MFRKSMITLFAFGAAFVASAFTPSPKAANSVGCCGCCENCSCGCGSGGACTCGCCSDGCCGGGSCAGASCCS